MSTISAHHHRLIQDLDDWDGEEPLGKWMETLGRIVGNMPGGDWLERFCDDKLGRTAAITVEVKEIMEDGDFRRPTAVEPKSPLQFSKVEEWDHEDSIKAETGVPRTPARTSGEKTEMVPAKSATGVKGLMRLRAATHPVSTWPKQAIYLDEALYPIVCAKIKGPQRAILPLARTTGHGSYVQVVILLYGHEKMDACKHSTEALRVLSALSFKGQPEQWSMDSLAAMSAMDDAEVDIDDVKLNQIYTSVESNPAARQYVMEHRSTVSATRRRGQTTTR